jgi:hypothetical protein
MFKRFALAAAVVRRSARRFSMHFFTLRNV